MTDWKTLLWGGQGVAHLALRSAAEVTDLVTEMHGTIKQVPLPLGPGPAQPGQAAPWPYRLVSRVFRSAASLLLRLPLQADLRPVDGWPLPVLSAANGVFGDKLEQWQSPLALGMTLRSADGDALAWSDLAASPKAKIALFLHGLCLSEREWQTPAHRQFVELLAQKGWSVGYLRYNSGRAIWRNGADLAEWLALAVQACPVRELTLVGHSQGGLLIRSAFACAEQQGQRWPERVSRAAYLATPHQGAPLERLGNRANALLSLSAYTRPFMRLGNLRSAAIRDLRYGLITAAESALAGDDCHQDPRQAACALPAHVHHFCLAGEIEAAEGQQWIGDGLVPAYSALGEHHREALRLDMPRLSRVRLPRLQHLALLSDVRAWDALADWWFSR